MKFPSLIKTNQYVRFHYNPRYYDPVKETIDKKMKKVKQRIQNGDSADCTSSISSAFQQRNRKSRRSSVVQMIIAVAMLGTFVGWLFYGNQVFYAYLLISPVYFYFRLKEKASKKN